MFLIIGIWGGDRRVYSAFKFFLYTLLGSVLMLIAIISIYWISGTTDVELLYDIGIKTKFQNLLWLAFFSSFAVKTPMWPVHTWLPDAHVEAPTAGSVLLAAILFKNGWLWIYKIFNGIISLCVRVFIPLIYFLSLVAIIYTSFVALMQEDMKVNSLLLCCAHGLCYFRNIHFHTTRFRRFYISNDKSWTNFMQHYF